ncbi:MAG: helix-turn-helix transcriptional regulator [Collimonas pratensis]|uniref:helix-turn-helix domain-containing protein n=1 Tax=Collimonas pratensis TaxID=279113 RepID=UPI003C771BBF
MKASKCKRCGGSGLEPNQAKIAKAMREKRAALQWTLERMAVTLGISIPYLSDLEKGRRAWSPERIKIVEALK